MKGKVSSRSQIISTFAIAVAVLFFGAIIQFAGANAAEPVLRDMSADAATSVGETDLCRVEELTVISVFASLKESETDYYLVSFKDGQQNAVYAMMAVGDSSPIYGRLKNYSEDASQSIGDLVLNGYFKAKDVPEIDGEDGGSLATYYQTAINKYKTGGNLDAAAQDLGYMLTYEGDQYLDPAKALEKADVGPVGILFIGIGVVLLLVGIRRVVVNKKLARPQETA